VPPDEGGGPSDPPSSRSDDTPPDQLQAETAPMTRHPRRDRNARIGFATEAVEHDPCLGDRSRAAAVRVAVRGAMLRFMRHTLMES
jgi:hypothetical protein